MLITIHYNFFENEKFTILHFILQYVFNFRPKQGHATFKVVFGQDALYETLDKETLREFKENAESEKYILEFNEQEFVFYLLPKMTIGENNYQEDTFYYRQKDSAHSFRPIDDDLFHNTVIKEMKYPDWKLTNETKKIGNYLCYKATSSFKTGTDEKSFTFPLIAWYCPQIPLEYGPKAYGGLPGMILELQERNIVYGVTKIEFTPLEKNSKLKKMDFSKKNIITFDQYVKTIREYYRK